MDSAKPKRWYARVVTGLGAMEFLVYAFLIVFVGFYLGSKALWQRSTELRTEGHYFISNDWFGPVDRTDYQWALFLRLQPDYWALGLAFLTLSYTVRYFFVDESGRSSSKARAIFYCLFGLAYIGYACRLQILVPIAIVASNYFLAKLLGGKTIAPYVFWIYNLAMIYLTYVYDRYAMLHPSLGWMDAKIYRGLMIWNEVCYILFLNCISFAMDYHWSVLKRPSPIDFSKNGEEDKKNLTWTWREENSQPEEEYSFINFFAFVFYAPTWMGPIGGFNAFASQLKRPQITYTRFDIAIYALRLIFAVALKELMDHFLFASAVNLEIFWLREFDKWSLLDYAMIPYYLLHTIWFKFLIMWRSWRLLALMDGMEYPENMNRCMSNNYTVEGFWRSWHRSFNQWLVRYLYFPLGGSRAGFFRRVLNIFIVFTAVIYFHAPRILREPHYLLWGYGMALFIVPEVVAHLFVSKVDPTMPSKWYYRHLVSLGGAFNIFVLILANMLGYGISIVRGDTLTREEIVLTVLKRFLEPGSWWFFAVVGAILFSSVQFMLLYREFEKERDGKAKAY